MKVLQDRKEKVVYETEVTRLRFKDNKLPAKKRKWVGLDFPPNDPIDLRNQGIEPLIINGSVGKTLIHII